MKKLLFVILSLFAVVAYADNTITSKEYVDGQVSSLQTQIPAKNTNTVVMNTGTAGEIGEKAIYDTTAAYGSQSDALVTAGAFNSAVQNALESEFVCVEWQGSVHDNAHCLLYEVRGAVQTQTLPSGYTQLEYIEATGEQYIDTGIVIHYGDCITTNLVITRSDGLYRPLFGAAQNGTARHLYVSYNGSGSWFANVFFEPVLLPNKMYNLELCVAQSDNQASRLVVNNINTYFAPITVEYLSLKIFARNGTEYRSMLKMYNLTIRRNNNLVIKLIPARRDSDGELGMYDTVSNTFFTNSGTGEFIAGPVVYF